MRPSNGIWDELFPTKELPEPMSSGEVFSLKVAHDLDYTIIYTDVKPRPARIEIEHAPYLHPAIGKEVRGITTIITGRPDCEREMTLQLLSQFGIKDVRLLCNPLKLYEQDYIATVKTLQLISCGATHYVEDNPHYRKIMGEYWDGECISVEEWVGMCGASSM